MTGLPSSLPPSIIRTIVPLIAGWLLSWPLISTLGITSDQAATAVSAVVSGLYYILFRLVEVYVAPRVAGLFLGLGATAPTYQPRHREAA